MKLRALIVALLSFWFAFGPALGALAQAADPPCESMAMTVPADECCEGAMEAAKCWSACVSSAPAMAAAVVARCPICGASSAVVAEPLRHASFFTPPEVAPPKSVVS